MEEEGVARAREECDRLRWWGEQGKKVDAGEGMRWEEYSWRSRVGKMMASVDGVGNVR